MKKKSTLKKKQSGKEYRKMHEWEEEERVFNMAIVKDVNVFYSLILLNRIRLERERERERGEHGCTK